MKKLVLLIISILVIVSYNINVLAKDTVISINKYQEEKLNYIIKSYDKENNIDGLITGGVFLKEEIEQDNNKYKDTQIMIIKYDKKGKLLWKYIYGETKEDNHFNLTYTYNDQGIIDGYLLMADKTSKIAEEVKKTIFIKLDLEGKLVLEKETTDDTILNKIIITYNDENKFDGYITIGKFNNTAIINKYDKEFNLIWTKEYQDPSYPETTYTDITNVYENNKITGYALIRETTENNKKINKIIRVDKEGNETKTIDLNEHLTYNLNTSNNGYILYGITDEVKLDKGNTSYYIINYSKTDEEIWETIGDTYTTKVKLHPISKESELKEYILLSSNKTNTEAIKFDLDGNIIKKIKKINSEYYDIKDFTILKDTLYIVGQINCPPEDTCDYDSNSLFIISDEDKVIEVKDNDSKSIIGIIIGVIIFIFIITFIKRKKRLNNSTR